MAARSKSMRIGIQPFTMLVARLAYETDRGAQLVYRFEWKGQ